MSWQFYAANGILKSEGGGGGSSTLDGLTDVDTTGAVDGALLRYEATGTTWADTTASTLLLSDAGQLQIPTTGSTGGLLVGGDVNLYRLSANTWRTDDSLAIGSTSMFSFELGASRFALSDANIDHIDSGTDNYIQWRGSADSQPRVRIGIGVGTGTTPGILLGPGSSTAPDIALYRSAANVLTLATGDKIQSDVLAITGSDLTNQVYTDRVTFFMA